MTLRFIFLQKWFWLGLHDILQDHTTVFTDEMRMISHAKYRAALVLIMFLIIELQV